MKHTALSLLLALSVSASAANPSLGRWALTIPGGGAGWLGVEEKDGQLSSSVLWGGGSVVGAKMPPRRWLGRQRQARGARDLEVKPASRRLRLGHWAALPTQARRYGV